MTVEITHDLIRELRQKTRSMPLDGDERLIGFVVDNARFELVEGSFMLRSLLDAAEASLWRPIETLGFGVEDHIIVATEYGFAWVVECDKDMDGEWLKKSYSKDEEHTGPVTHWRVIDLPRPTRLPRDQRMDDYT